MKRFVLISIVGLVLIGLATTPAFCQSADEVLAKMVEAMGGRKFMENVTDMTLMGNMEMIPMAMSGSMTMYQKRPDKMRMEFEMMGSMITQAFDGTTAWGTNPQTGATQAMPDQMSQSFKRRALGNEVFLNPEKYSIKYSLKENENVDGKDCLVLVQTFSDEHQVTLYIDSATYLTYKSKSTEQNQMGAEVEADTVFSDYKKVEDAMVPHQFTMFQDGQEFMKMTISEVSFNTDLEDSLFQMN